MIDLPLVPFTEEMILPTNAGAEKLLELKWNFIAQDAIIGFNMPAPSPQKGEFARIVNSFFFDADEYGLKTRHIKWIDFIPIETQEEKDKIGVFFDLTPYSKLIDQDLNYRYPLPEGFDLERLVRINRFIEFLARKDVSEPDITTFLSRDEYKFLLSMRFAANDIFPQLLCEWQTEKRDNLQPDFFVLNANGYADIVEFKLPDLKGKTVVGRTNRETFSAEINSYISQTRTYSTYFDDPNNRSWFEDKYGFKVHKPRRYLVAGRRSDFSSAEWRELISDYRDVEILSYDDLLDGVVAQFYTQ